jgi:hypothetical protein
MTLSDCAKAFAWLRRGIADAPVAKNPMVSAKTVVLIKSRPPCSGSLDQTTVIDLSDQPVAGEIQ